MTIVVVEGSDGAGKTTLIERAREGQRERYFLTVRASRYPPDVKTALQYLNWIKHQRDLDLILDRIHFISDRVYGPVLRNEDLFQNFPLDFGLQDAAVIVYCRPPLELIQENVAKNHQMKGVIENIDDLVARYDHLMAAIKQKGKKVIKYDYTADEPGSFWRYVWGETKRK
jgi:hypothetical protein